MTRIQVPPATNLSIAQLGDVFRAQGFVIEQLTDDRLQAVGPRSVYSDIFPVERWFPAARIVIERSGAGFTFSYRPASRRLAMANLTTGLLVFATIPGVLATRLLLAAASVGLLVILQFRHARRQPTLLATQSAASGAFAAIPGK
jgi:hypothetical protein